MLRSAEFWSWVGAIQALVITIILSDGRYREAGCWIGLITEPVWIATPFVVGNRSYGYAALGVGFLLSYAWGLLRDRTTGEVIRRVVLRMPA